MLVFHKNKKHAAAGSLVIKNREPHFVIVSQSVPDAGTLTLRSSNPLAYLHDSDDGRPVLVGETVHGNVDYPGDWDYFVLDLGEDETVEAKNRSSVLDLVLTVNALDRDGQIDFGMVRTAVLRVRDSSTAYQAPRTGSYILRAYRDSRGAPSGYVFELKPAEPDLALTYTPRGSRVRSPRAASTPTP